MLEGRTERGQRVALVLYDDRLHSVEAEAPVYCPEHRAWRSVRWTPVDGAFGVFRQEGDRFRVSQRADSRRTGARTPDTTVALMRGRLADDGESARGTIDTRWHWDRFDCRATVRFSAG